MSKPSDPTGFGQFVPGFDFLQKLAQGGNTPFQHWVAPTLDPEALDKRIHELKAVQFWLEQNAAALKATLQALEVQKMTLAALKTMNVPMPSAGAAWPMPGAAPAAKAPAPKADAPQAQAPKAAPAVEPMQYWGALTRQFQQIATDAMKDVAARAAVAQAAMPPASTASAAPAAAGPKPRAAKKATPRSRKTD
ncbi:MAG: PhaM family polyhydroxyalkanoate granule multifunctional regulatory protein [Curvibacter sp.]|jgi:hypothetical protein|nr:hypothetical protein [Curvibacter sp.]